MHPGAQGVWFASLHPASLNIYIKPAGSAGSAGSDLSFQLFKRLGFERSRSAWATEYFQGQPTLYGQTMSQNKTEGGLRMQLRERLRNFLGDPGLHPDGAGGSFTAPQSSFVSFPCRPQGQTDRQLSQQ